MRHKMFYGSCECVCVCTRDVCAVCMLDVSVVCVSVLCVCAAAVAGRYNNIFGNILLCREVWYISRKGRGSRERGCSRESKRSRSRESRRHRSNSRSRRSMQSCRGGATHDFHAIHTVGFPSPTFHSPALYALPPPHTHTHTQRAARLKPHGNPPCSLSPPLWLACLSFLQL